MANCVLSRGAFLCILLLGVAPMLSSSGSTAQPSKKQDGAPSGVIRKSSSAAEGAPKVTPKAASAPQLKAAQKRKSSPKPISGPKLRVAQKPKSSQKPISAPKHAVDAAPSTSTQGLRSKDATAVPSLQPERVLIAKKGKKTRDTCPSGSAPSAFYGCGGETFDATGPLQDWSSAGYAANSRPIPNWAVSKNAKTDFGCAGDGVTDDTKCLQKAFDNTPWNTALFIPKGTYVVTKIIKSAAKIVIRGAGKGVTTIYMPLSIKQAYRTSWFNPDGPHFIHFNGYGDLNPAAQRTAVKTVLARVAYKVIPRGSKTIAVTSTAKFTKGQWILIDISGRSGKLGSYLEGNCYPPTPGSRDARLHQHINQVLGIGSTTIRLKFPLPFNLYDQPPIYTFLMEVDGIGLEDMTFEFPWTVYPGHFKEQGFNAVKFSTVSNYWVSNVEFINSDFPLLLAGHFGHVSGITIRNSQPRDDELGFGCHHAITMWRATNVVVNNFEILHMCQHDLSTGNFDMNIVYKNGVGVDINFDSHRQTPYGVLFSNINVGRGTRWLESSGSPKMGKAHAGAYNTYWNIKTSAPELPLVSGIQRIDPVEMWYDLATKANFIGPKLTGAVRTDAQGAPGCGWILESVDGLYPRDLHAAQVSQLNL